MRPGSCRAGVNAVFTAGSPRPPVLTIRSSSPAVRRRRAGSRSPRRAARASARGPSATSVSNSGGVAVLPGRRDADRHEQVAGLPAARLDELAQRRLELVGLPGHGVVRGEALARRREALAPWSRRPSAWARRRAGSTVELVDPQEARRGRRSRRGSAAARGRSAAGRAARPRSGRRSISPLATAAASRNGSSRSTRSSSSRRRIHWPFSHSSRSRSKRAPPFWTFVDARTAARARRARSTSSSVPGRPAEEREVVDERLADEALRDVVGDRGLALALAHLRAVGVEDQRQVAEHRDRVAQRLEQQDVLGRVADVVLAADHVADRHRRVVDDHGEVVERRAVGPDDDEVAAEVGGVDLDPVADRGRPSRRRRRERGTGVRRPAALGLPRRALVGGQRRAAADVAGRLLRRLLGLAVGVELLGRAVAGIGAVRRPAAAAAAAA